MFFFELNEACSRSTLLRKFAMTQSDEACAQPGNGARPKSEKNGVTHVVWLPDARPTGSTC